VASNGMMLLSLGPIMPWVRIAVALKLGEAELRTIYSAMAYLQLVWNMDDTEYMPSFPGMIR
jgi:hypothetical protein